MNRRCLELSVKECRVLKNAKYKRNRPDEEHDRNVDVTDNTNCDRTGGMKFGTRSESNLGPFNVPIGNTTSEEEKISPVIPHINMVLMSFARLKMKEFRGPSHVRRHLQ